MRIFLFFLTALITVAVAACGGVSGQAPTPSRPAPTNIPTVIAGPATEGAGWTAPGKQQKSVQTVPSGGHLENAARRQERQK